MEQKKIDELMRSRGYSKAIGPIFSEWEFVKDEILLPDRKEGSGNGTVHIYLLEDNMDIFRKCFSEYVEAFGKDPKESEKMCPRVSHFVMTANVMTVAGFAYMHYKCDANSFNYASYIHKVLRNDDDGMISFESLFKFTTSNRPYFKQFDKDVFGKLIRYVFVPKKTAYKIYLYSDEAYENFATFWLIGQIPDNTFVVGKPFGVETKEQQDVVAGPNEITNAPISTPNDVKQRFIDYMLSSGMPIKTAKSYVGDINHLVPIAQKMLDGQDHPSPFTITNIDELKRISETLWSNDEIVKWNAKKHYHASAALRMYIKMYEKVTIDKAPEDTKVAHVLDYTLTQEEEQRKKDYCDYLRNEKEMADVTVTSYSNNLQKRLSALLRDHYESNFRNVYSINDPKILMKMEDHIWDIPAVNKANEKLKGKLSAAFRAYIDYNMSELSDDELATIAFGQASEGVEDIEQNVETRFQYVNYLPLYSVKAACGDFANEEPVEKEGWVDVSKSGIKAKEDMFVVHAKGSSMEPRIHDNDLCVFQKYRGGDLENEIVLTQLITHDIDYGGMYTIKKYHGVKEIDENGSTRNIRVELLSYNPAYTPIVLSEDNADDVKTVGVFVGVLRANDD